MTIQQENSWRKFQDANILDQKKNRAWPLPAKLLAGALVVAAVSALAFFAVHRDWGPPHKKPDPPAPEQTLPEKKAPLLSRAALADLIDPMTMIRSDRNVLFSDSPDHSYKITTAMDPDLQQYLLSILQNQKARNQGKPRQIAFVVLEPATGRLLAMTGFDLDTPGRNPCTAADYPAASLFKIVTAAAAVERLGYRPGTPFYFNGGKYTLYKSQLREIRNRYSLKVSFASAFAESVNPVFGKIGKNRLGREPLEQYARAFGFNEQVPSELGFTSGSFSTSESAFHLAELGCGFNTDTTISPVFGAMMAAAVINEGRMPLPLVVEHVTNGSGKIIYKHKKETYKTAITADTASILVSLMRKTITSGTAKKAFGHISRDKILSGLTIGGKTGSLYNKAHTVKYDWFSGFAKERGQTGRAIAFSILVGHGEYLGTRAAAFGKKIIKYYFKPDSTGS